MIIISFRFSSLPAPERADDDLILNHLILITFTKIDEFLLKMRGPSRNDNICAFFAKCRELQVRGFRKKIPLSVRRYRGWGAKGAIESVRSFVTLLQ